MVCWDRTIFVWDTTIWISGIWGCKKILRNIDQIAFKVVQMKFLAMHITNQKISFEIFKVGNVLNIFMEHDPCNIFWAISINIPQMFYHFIIPSIILSLSVLFLIIIIISIYLPIDRSIYRYIVISVTCSWSVYLGLSIILCSVYCSVILSIILSFALGLPI